MSVIFSGNTYTISGTTYLYNTDSATYEILLSGTTDFTLRNTNQTITTQTGSLTYQNAINTQIVKYNSGDYINSSIVFTNSNTKTFILLDDAKLTTTNITGNGNIYLQNNSKLTATTCTGSGILYVGVDTSLSQKIIVF